MNTKITMPPLVREDEFDPSGIEFISSLILAFQSSKIKSCDPHFKSMIKNEILNRFKEDNITFKIYPTKDGRFKLRQPFQMCRKHQLDLLIELFRYYYGRDPDHDMTVESIFQEWIEDFKASYVDTGHRSTLTYERYKTDWNRFFAGSPIAKTDICKLKASAVKAYYAKICANAGITRRSLNNAKTILNRIFDYAVDRDYINFNVARSVRTSDLLCKEEDNEELVYSDEERNKVMLQAQKEDDVFARAIFLMFSLCVRIGELRSLKWSDIDFDSRTVYIHSQIVRQKDNDGHEHFTYVNRTKGKKKEANRKQPLSDDAIKLLRKQRADNPFGEYIFLYKGKPLVSNTINHHLMRICERVQVPYMSSHKIRFWSVVNMSKVLNPAEVQHLAGHLDPATTDHYRKRVSKVKDVDQDTWNSMYMLAK